MLVLELCRVGSEQIQGNPTPPATTHYPTSITQECTTQTMTMTMTMTITMMMMMGTTLECTTQTMMVTMTMMVMKDERDMKFNIGG